MTVITVPSRVDTGFGDGLNSFFRIQAQIIAASPGEELEFDLTRCSFLNPFLILPLMLMIERESKTRSVLVSKGPDRYFCSYLDLINFGVGLIPEEVPQGAYHEHLNRYETKNYIPIINFSADEFGPQSQIRDQCLSAVKKLIINQLKLKGPFVNAVMFLITEAVVNIVEHSGAQRGYVFAQYYPSRQYLDLCLCDVGKGILQSFQESPIGGIFSHQQALAAAASGQSTKNRPEAEGRGFGISSSKRMLAEGLQGSYFLLSGNSFLVKYNDYEAVIEIPDEYKWQGTILALRIPLNKNPQFQATDYYEG